MVQDGPMRPAAVLAVHWVPGSGPARGCPPSPRLGRPLSAVLTAWRAREPKPRVSSRLGTDPRLDAEGTALAVWSVCSGPREEDTCSGPQMQFPEVWGYLGLRTERAELGRLVGSAG